MKSLTALYYVCLLGLFLLFGCTGNDILDDEVEPYSRKTLTGNVTLAGESDNSKIYVWIEKINIGTYTDSKGDFKITIPASYSQKGISSHKIFYFVSNFTVDSDTVSIKDGNFEFGTAALNFEGRIKNKTELQKAFEFFPDKDSFPYSSMTMKFYYPTKVKMPYSSMIMVGLSNYFVTSNYKYKADGAADYSKNVVSSEWVELSGNSTSNMLFYFDVKSFETNSIPYGIYKIMPMVYGNFDKIPQQMIDNLLADFNNFENFDNYTHRLNSVSFNWSQSVHHPGSI